MWLTGKKQFDEFAELYDELFTHVCDYKKEADHYHSIFKKHGVKKILEIGCGAAHRSKYFIDKGYDYVGLDISKSMIALAKKHYPSTKLVVGDVRDLNITQKFDAVIFLGKGSIYLNTNKDVMDALKSIKKVMDKGLIIIDGFNANFIIPNFKTSVTFSKKAGNKTITRKSKNSLDMKTGWTWQREVTYFVNKKKMFVDIFILRAFSKEEMKNFFDYSGIKIVRFIENGDTLVSIGKV